MKRIFSIALACTLITSPLMTQANQEPQRQGPLRVFAISRADVISAATTAISVGFALGVGLLCMTKGLYAISDAHDITFTAPSGEIHHYSAYIQLIKGAGACCLGLACLQFAASTIAGTKKCTFGEKNCTSFDAHSTTCSSIDTAECTA